MLARLASITCAMFVAFGSFSSIAKADALADIKSKGVVRIAVPQDFQPFGGIGPDMQPMGYDIDVAKTIAEKLDVQVELVPVNSANRIPYIQTGKVDLIVAILGRTPERDLILDFSSPYGLLFNAVFAPADVSIKTAADLSGKTIGVTRGTIIDIELSKVIPADANVKRFEDENGTAAAFLSNQVDVIGTGDLVAKSIVKKNPPRVPEVKFVINRSPLYVGVSKGEKPLVEAVNAILTAMKSDGSLNKIADKWLGEPLPADL